jgi:hypothetical protein
MSSSRKRNPRAEVGRRRAWLAGTLALSIVAIASAAPPPVTTIEIAEGYGPPGTKVTMPVDFKASDGVRAGAVEIRLTLPPTLTFEAAAASGLSQGVGAELTSEQKGDAVRVVLAVRGEPAGSPPRPIPDGTIAYLTFTIAQTATPESVIPLEPQAILRPLGDGPNAVVPMKAAATRIVVTAPPIPSCLFYMH